jgi:hypothetical protein
MAEPEGLPEEGVPMDIDAEGIEDVPAGLLSDAT